MQVLTGDEIGFVSAGMDNFNILALSAIGGTIFGGSIGSLLAWQGAASTTLSLFPIWIAAGTAAGSAIGLFVGIAFAVGGACINCYDFSNNG